ncbi:putative toxin-antitoxin system toxin component, PIN family [Iningainema tapete]|nr:putative toxin-antitoxin system toxin component, PIN family [Iningainema tapete]
MRDGLCVMFIDMTEQINECRDPKDNKYLELALSGQAECIVTGDNDLLVLNPWRGIEILTVQEFLALK